MRWEARGHVCLRTNPDMVVAIEAASFAHVTVISSAKGDSGVGLCPHAYVRGRPRKLLRGLKASEVRRRGHPSRMTTHALGDAFTAALFSHLLAAVPLVVAWGVPAVRLRGYNGFRRALLIGLLARAVPASCVTALRAGVDLAAFQASPYLAELSATSSRCCSSSA